MIQRVELLNLKIQLLFLTILEMQLTLKHMILKEMNLNLHLIMDMLRLKLLIRKLLFLILELFHQKIQVVI